MCDVFIWWFFFLFFTLFFPAYFPGIRERFMRIDNILAPGGLLHKKNFTPSLKASKG